MASNHTSYNHHPSGTIIQVRGVLSLGCDQVCHPQQTNSWLIYVGGILYKQYVYTQYMQDVASYLYKVNIWISLSKHPVLVPFLNNFQPFEVGSESKPLRSLQVACDRAVQLGGKTPTVVLRKGTHFLDETLMLGNSTWKKNLFVFFCKSPRKHFTGRTI